MIICHCLKLTDRDICKGTCAAGSCCGGCIAAVNEILAKRKLMEKDLDDVGFEMYSDGEHMFWELSEDFILRMTKAELENLVYKAQEAIEELESGASGWSTNSGPNELDFEVDLSDRDAHGNAMNDIDEYMNGLDDLDDYGFDD